MMAFFFVAAIIFFLLNAIYLLIASCIYEVFGDGWGDVILLAPLVIGLLWIIGWFGG